MKFQDVRNHFDAVCLTFLFKYGPDFRPYFAEMAKYWEGPLYDRTYFVWKRMFEDRTLNKYLMNLLSRLKGVKFHPIYNRDFMQGVVDAGCMATKAFLFPRLVFRRNLLLRKFLESDIHGFNIRFDNCKTRERTKTVPFFCLPYEGDLDLYLAGAITASKPIMKNGELLFAVGKNCSENFRKFNIVFQEDRKRIYLSPFYVLLFLGEIPGEIAFDFTSRIARCGIKDLKQGCLDSLFHWRMLHGHDKWSVNDYPLLQSYVVYNRYFEVERKMFDVQMEGERKDFVDRRIVKRCDRWYSINSTFNNKVPGSTEKAKEKHHEVVQIHSLQSQGNP